MSDNTPKREIHRLAIASDGVNKPLEGRFLNGEPILTIHPDGRVTTSNRLKPDEIASTVLEMMKEQWMANPQAKLIRELNDRIKRLEEAGDRIALAYLYEPKEMRQFDALSRWQQAKEANL